MSCPTFENWVAFLDGEAPALERLPLVRHLAGCRACEEVFVSAGTARQTFLSAGSGWPPSGLDAHEVAELARAAEAGTLDDLRLQRLALDPPACAEVFIARRTAALGAASAAPDLERVMSRVRPVLAASPNASPASTVPARSTRRAPGSRRTVGGGRQERAWAPFLAAAAAVLLVFVMWRTAGQPVPGSVVPPKPGPVAVAPPPAAPAPVVPAVPPPAPTELARSPAAPATEDDPAAPEQETAAVPVPAEPFVANPASAPDAAAASATSGTRAEPAADFVRVVRTAGSLRRTSPESFVSGYAAPGWIETADGDRIVLRPRAELTLGADPAARLFVLKRGEAAFEVEKADRPFVVRTDAGDAVAIGTRYVVGVAEKRMRLAVLEGTVVLRAGGGHPPVTAGQECDVENGTITPLRAIVDPSPYAWADPSRMDDGTPWIESVPATTPRGKGIVFAVPRGGRERYAEEMASAAGEALGAGVVIAHGHYDPARRRESFVYLPVEGAGRRKTPEAKAVFDEYVARIVGASGQAGTPVPMLVEVRGHALQAKGKPVEEAHLVAVGFPPAALQEARRAYDAAARDAGFGGVPLKLEGEGAAGLSLDAERTEGTIGPKVARRGAAFLVPPAARRDADTAERYGRVLARVVEALSGAR